MYSFCLIDAFVFVEVKYRFTSMLIQCCGGWLCSKLQLVNFFQIITAESIINNNESCLHSDAAAGG